MEAVLVEEGPERVICKDVCEGSDAKGPSQGGCGGEEQAGSARSLFNGGAGAAVISSWHHRKPFSSALRCQMLPGTAVAGGRRASLGRAGRKGSLSRGTDGGQRGEHPREG